MTGRIILDEEFAPAERELPFANDEWHVIVDRLKFSPRQARIAELILRGRRDKDIAAALGLRLPTVRTYLQRMYLRAGVKDRVGLVIELFLASGKHGVSRL